MTSALDASTQLLGLITPHILAKGIAPLRATCKQWQVYIDKTDSIWQQLFENEGIPKLLGQQNNFMPSFKRLYPLTALSRRIFEETFQATFVGKIPLISDDVFSIAEEMIDPVLVILPKWIGAIPAHKQEFDRKTLSNFRHMIGHDEYASPLILPVLIDLCNASLPAKEKSFITGNDYLRIREAQKQIENGFPTQNYHPQVYLIERQIVDASRGELQTRLSYFEKSVADKEFHLPPLLLRALFDVTMILGGRKCPDSSGSFAEVLENYSNEQTGQEFIAFIGGYQEGKPLQFDLHDHRAPYIENVNDLGIAKCRRIDIEPPIDKKVQFEIPAISSDDDMGVPSSSEDSEAE